MPSGEAGRGFTYVWMLAALVIVSIGLAAVGQGWTDYARRQRELELLRVGAIYANAIAEYRAMSPGSLRQYPPDLFALVEDRRMIGTVRHIRKLYADPLDPKRPWGIVHAADGGVLGVYSQSDELPLRTAPVDIGDGILPIASRYSDWKFRPKEEK